MLYVHAKRLPSALLGLRLIEKHVCASPPTQSDDEVGNEQGVPGSPLTSTFKRPHAHAPWEDDAGIAEIAMVAEAADRLGYHHVTCSEHVAVPFSAGEMRGAAYWDPLSTFGYLAARTTQIRLVTHVLVLGYHHPLEIAKRYGTLDRVSDGRLILGVGVGTLQEEF